ncbi:MAG: ABC transporter permease [Christensenellales bacterium]|nr:ABC transporter permease [Christensenellales bacterium]
MKRKVDIQKLLAPAALVILYVFFSFTGRNFFGYDGLKQILQSCYYIGFMAFGVTFVIITGGIDLSLGSNMLCSALLGGVAYSVWGWPLIPSLIFVLFIGLFFGTCNGLMIAKLKLPPFIATLGTQMITLGFSSIVSKVRTMYYPTVGSTDEWFRSLFYIHGDIPTGAAWLIGAFLVAWFLLNKTRFGRYAFAIGSNEEATRLSGVNVDKWKISVYAVCGLFTAMAGIFYGAAYTTIMPGKGNGEEMNGIAAVVIGGTSMAGGAGSMFGTLIGVLVMATLKKGLASVGLQAHWQTFFTGFVVIGAVLLDNVLNRAAIKSASKG